MLSLTQARIGESSSTASALLWLSTGWRRHLLRLARLLFIYCLCTFWSGPSASLAPATALQEDIQLPHNFATGNLHPQFLTPMQAEKLLGAPLLDSPLLHRGDQDIGLWAEQFYGPFGHTVAIFHLFRSPHQSWLMILQLRTQRPLLEPTWDFLDSHETLVNGHTARLFDEYHSLTVAWQASPTMEISLSEELMNPPNTRDRLASTFLNEEAFLQIADSLHPQGIFLGPFALWFPWQ